MKKVSIIVPVYNAAVFLSNSIGSILKQSYRNLEIILINDCSTDNSLEICKSFATHDNRIVIIDKKQNEGVDYARFSGIEKATGDYVTFLDADDWLAKNSVEIWLDTMEKNNVDIVYSNMTRVFSQRFGIYRKPKFNPEIIERVVSGQEKDKLIVSFFGVNIVPVNLCGNLYKRTLFSGIRKSGLKFGEDLLVGLQLYHNASSYIITSKSGYYYRFGGGYFNVSTQVA